MRRRSFIKNAILGSTLSPSGLSASLGLATKKAQAANFPSHQEPLLVNITLDGGPDFRHLFAPPFSSDLSTYAGQFWYHRARVYGLESTDSSGLQAASSAKYDSLSLGNHDISVLKSCGWLQDKLRAGKCAIINNVIGSTNRDHPHSLILWESGALGATPYDFDRSGWGGRLAATLNEGVISVTRRTRLFAHSPQLDDSSQTDPSKGKDFSDSRNVALYHYHPTADSSANEWKYSSRAILSRSLKSYYQAKADEMLPSSPFYRVIQHEQKLRSFGDTINARLGSIPIPDTLAQLYHISDDGDIESTLSIPDFGRQMLSIYDGLCCQDILAGHIFSADLSGFDTHKLQVSYLEPRFGDLFAHGGGLDTLETQLRADMPDAAAQLIYVIGGEFGRQLAANGDEGTDHGRGNSVLIIGDQVNGGVYGEMYPSDEIASYPVANSDITGKTSTTQVFAKICEHMKAGSAASVFDAYDSDKIESVGLLDQLFTA